MGAERQLARALPLNFLVARRRSLTHSLAPPFPFPQTANRTKEVAAATQEDVERQGDQLGRVRGDLNTVREEERQG